MDGSSSVAVGLEAVTESGMKRVIRRKRKETERKKKKKKKKREAKEGARMSG